ncbi:MAG: precorrin-3B synthase [Hyphomicrobium sp.]|uniref:precorrin-3B synthase n=1 Tax=Hyphomicrobium sp. TaxID=82 RepID=UPI0039E47E35
MTRAAHLRKGWCPGALRPMRSGDGLLVRVRPRAGAFSLPALRAVGAVAAQFGSGEIDLTNRGNLQIRGVTDATFQPALAALDSTGLLDASAEAEAVRNIVVDPLSGIDPGRADVRLLAAGMEGILARDKRMWGLPAKFGFSLSGTSEPRVGDRDADVMISADADHFAIALDGAPDVRCAISRDEAIDAAHRLALTFVELNENHAGFRRMRDAVARLGVATVFAMSGLRMPVTRTTAARESRTPIGVEFYGGNTFAVGAGLPFGRITAHQLDALCMAAASHSERVHLSPERAFVFPVEDAEGCSALLHDAEMIGLITRKDDIRLAMDVCPGAPACKSAVTDTRRDAERFAQIFAGSLGGCSLHISGCEKGCARRGKASFTLVGRCGRYDVIRNGPADASNVLETIKAEDISDVISRLIMEPVT